MLIGICGKMGSGKSTVSSFITTDLQGVSLQFADFLKHITYCLFNINPNRHTKKSRQLWQKIGAFMRSIDENAWVNYLIKNYHTNYDEFDYVVVSDIRYPNEAKAVLDEGGIVIVLHVDDDVRRKRIEKRDKIKFSDEEWKEINQHESEINVDLIGKMDVKHIYITPNDDINAVNSKVQKFIRASWSNKKGCVENV